MKKISLLLALSICISSCASNKTHKLQNLDLSKVNHKKEGIFFGKIQVKLDNKIVNEKCLLNFRSNVDEFAVQVSKSGEFQGSAKDGKVFLDGISCDGEFMNFKKDTVVFENKKGKQKNYLGEIEVQWEPGGVNPAIAVLGLLIGWIAIVNDGDKFAMKNNQDNSSRYLASNNNYHKSLLQVPYGLWPNKDHK